MHILPVIDLMHGQVVQAIQGQRQHYRPIQSQLTESHALIDIVAAILQVYPFDCLYIADLNAITGQGTLPNHLSLIQQAMVEFPQLAWWIDAGFQTADQLIPWQSARITPILASESMQDDQTYAQMRQTCPNSLLSLDFFQDGFHGPTQLLSAPQQWTHPTIVMSLPKVGANRGPDHTQLATLKAQHPQQALYAAGGVRDAQDIETLSQAGASGVLIASALHQKQLTAHDLSKWGA
ncbi:HisA/HisF-related TIM barrel protein [Methylophilus sp. DW102]|uniref:HisA/HisF-related TIM barrel protein n=1 Tax=Methylophilus sp. DW102 TaxID=3095607 RepID=UPI0030885EBE|nr:HisA/HisF-related TIM barrel protein [Methylophilus sp. DW102]